MVQLDKATEPEVGLGAVAGEGVPGLLVVFAAACTLVAVFGR